MSNNTYPQAPPIYEWNNNRNGTYTSYIEPGVGPVYKPIPSHPKLQEIYWYVFDYARDSYMSVDMTLTKCIENVKEKYGEISPELEDYLSKCPWDAGNRAGLLDEEPDHYL